VEDKKGVENQVGSFNFVLDPGRLPGLALPEGKDLEENVAFSGGLDYITLK
jgi:hypothetical protein